MSLPLEILKVAKELIADDVPVGMSEKGKAALAMLREGLANKKIYNPDFEDAKSILSRDFEKAISAMMNGKLPLLGKLLYVAGDASFSLNSISKPAREIRGFIQRKDFAEISRYYQPQYDNTAQTIIDNWNAYAADAERYLKDVETWAVISSLIKEVKPYIVKGRKPIERGPDYVPSQYVPPMAGTQAIKMVMGKLSEIVESQRASLVDRMTRNSVEKLSKYSGDGSYRDIKKFLESNYLDEYFRVAFEDIPKSFPKQLYKLRDDLESSVRVAVERGVQEMVDRYVHKNTSKIAPIIHAKGEPKKVDVGWGNLQGWGFAGVIRFEFEDGTKFRVDNQAVWKMTYRGKPFYQFPTTFHDVRFKNGTVKSMVPEQAMNEVWAKEA